MDTKNLEDTFKFENSYWWFLGRRRVIHNLINKFFTHRKNSLALDVGCGTGIMLSDLEKFTTPIGIDRSEVALHYVKKQRGKNIVQGDICRMPFKEGSFDLITTLGVLYNEDVWSEEAAIEEFFRVLKRDGILIVDESAYDFLQSRYNLGWGGVRRYTRSRLRGLAKQFGFKILKTSYWNVPMLAVAYLIVKIENLFNLKRGYYPIGRINIFLNSILKNYLYLEASLLKHLNFPFGTMVFIVAKKP